jgi:pyruvate/2-oxoglutarate dehydrogenase complex dihydrolipoamide acyltransferase (E2) component
MPTPVVLPSLSEGMEFAAVLHWHKAPGDPVRAGETLLEVEAEKANYEIEAPCDGTLREVLAEAGDEVPAGAVLGTIEKPA